MSLAIARTSEPATEPLSLVEGKQHLRLTTSNEDDLINAYIGAARDRVEVFTSRALITQTWTAYFDSFDDPEICDGFGALAVPRPPLQSITSIKYQDEDDVQQTLSTDVYAVDTTSIPGRVYLKPDQSWPTVYAKRHAIEMIFVAGYGTSSADLPSGIVHATRLLLSHYYEVREPIVLGTIATQIPESIQSLLWSYRIWETL